MGRLKLFKSAVIICSALSLCLVIYLITSNNSRPASSSGAALSVTVTDVGQGDSILITLGDETMLIDAAESYESGAVLDELEKQRVDDIDILVATHPHDDHIGGLKAVIENYSVGEIYIADTPSETKTYKKLMKSINDKRIPVTEAYAGIEFSFGQASCTIVSPGKQDDYDANNESVAIFLDYMDSEFLFTGDMEQTAEDELVSSGYNIDADVLKVAHHGSSTGTSEDFLQAVSPDYAAISCGEGNVYKHPHDKTLDLLSGSGIKTYRTDISGDISFVSDGRNVNVVLEKGAS